MPDLPCFSCTDHISCLHRPRSSASTSSMCFGGYLKNCLKDWKGEKQETGCGWRSRLRVNPTAFCRSGTCLRFAGFCKAFHVPLSSAGGLGCPPHEAGVLVWNRQVPSCPESSSSGYEQGRAAPTGSCLASLGTTRGVASCLGAFGTLVLGSGPLFKHISCSGTLIFHLI